MNAMHTTSLIRKAERIADAIETAASSVKGLRARRVTHHPTKANAPETSSAAESSIIPKSRPSVRPSTAAWASSTERTPKATSRTAPMTAAAMRSERKPGTRPTENAT